MNGGGSGEAERDYRLINGTMPELTLSPVGLEGTKLSIRPPILVVGKRSEEDGGIGREGAGGVFRRNN